MDKTWFVPLWLCQFCKLDTRGCKLRRAWLSGTPFVWTGQASKAFHLFKAPRAESIFEEFLFSKFFFFAPSNILFKRKWDVYLLFPYFFSGKQRVVDFLPLPSLPSFFPKVLIWEKENEVLFLFSFLSHLNTVPASSLSSLQSVHKTRRERERERDREARDQVKHGGCCSHWDSGAGKLPMQSFLPPFQCPWDGYCCGHLQQKMLYWV